MMTPSVVTLQEVLRHHRTLSRRGREFYESLLHLGDVLAVRVDYLPGAMLWLVTTPKQAQLMRKAREGRPTSDVCVMSLREAQDLFGAVGDPDSRDPLRGRRLAPGSGPGRGRAHLRGRAARAAGRPGRAVDAAAPAVASPRFTLAVA